MKIYILAFLLSFLFSIPQSSPLPAVQQEQKSGEAVTANIVFKSIDGGQTWQDIGEGLPEILKGDGIRGVSFSSNDDGLFLLAGNGIYHSKPNSTAPFWKKESFHFPGKQGSIAADKTGIIAYNSEGEFLQKIKGEKLWSRVYSNFQGNSIRTVFETAGGTVFIGTNYHLNNNQLFKSTNRGKTWKQVQTGGMVANIVESNGVLLATGAGGILRSTDDGETWHCVIREGVIGIDVELIKGGFAAITHSNASNTRRVRTSYDGGVTWQPIDAGLPAHRSITSIIQVGEYFFSTHPAGIYRSSDKGKTWKLLVPSVKDKVFTLFVSGNVLYAIPRFVGC